jgi:hypothetical protein
MLLSAIGDGFEKFDQDATSAKKQTTFIEIIISVWVDSVSPISVSN